MKITATGWMRPDKNFGWYELNMHQYSKAQHGNAYLGVPSILRRKPVYLTKKDGLGDGRSFRGEKRVKVKITIESF